MSGQICWSPYLQPDVKKVLHIRTNPSESWRPYKACPQYAVPDYGIPNGSRGWSTYHKLLRASWKLIPREQAGQKNAIAPVIFN